MAKPNARTAGPRSRKSVCFACVAILLAGAMASAQAGLAPAKSKRPRAGHPAVTSPVPTAAPQPQAPEPPKWPANEAPQQPTVIWNSQGLRIQASNSNLSQILNQISTETGAKIEGLGKDERVYGEYGPGQAKDVLAQLLRGSGYDYLMLGDEGQGTPRTIVLSARKNTPPAPQNPAMNNTPDQQDDETVPDADSDEPDQPPPVIQPAPQQQPENSQPPMTPQQRMQLMQQQRLQQMQEMQRQYQQQQQQKEQPQ